MKIINAPLADLIPYARNPRQNTDAVDKVAASIKEFGFRQPIVVDSEMVIVAGHTRYLAAKKLKLANVPVHVAKDLTAAQAKAYRLADNRTHEEAKWDDELLALELGELEETPDLNLKITGFDADEIEKYLNRETDTGNGTGDNEPKDNYKEQYGVIVVCENEDQQEEIYAKLTEQGYNCKVVVT